MDISPINAVSAPDTIPAPVSLALPAPLLPSEAYPAVQAAVNDLTPAATTTPSPQAQVMDPIQAQVASTVPTAEADSLVLGNVPQTTVPDALPSMLQSIYRSPTLPLQFYGVYQGDIPAARQEALLHVMAPMSLSPTSEHANGRPYNPNAYPMNPATPEAMAAHHARAALATGKPPITQRIVSGSNEAVIGHFIDLLG